MLKDYLHAFGFDLYNPPTIQTNNLGILFHELGHMLDAIERGRPLSCLLEVDLGLRTPAYAVDHHGRRNHRPHPKFHNTVIINEAAAESYALCLREEFYHPLKDDPSVALGDIYTGVIARIHQPENPPAFIERVERGYEEKRAKYPDLLNQLRDFWYYKCWYYKC